jgi:hypothetical protein
MSLQDDNDDGNHRDHHSRIFQILNPETEEEKKQLHHRLGVAAMTVLSVVSMIIAVIEFVMGDDSSAATTPVILKK